MKQRYIFNWFGVDGGLTGRIRSTDQGEFYTSAAASEHALARQRAPLSGGGEGRATKFETGRWTDEHWPCCYPAICLCLISTDVIIINAAPVCLPLIRLSVHRSLPQPRSVLQVYQNTWKWGGQNVSLSPLFRHQWGVYCVTGLAH